MVCGILSDFAENADLLSIPVRVTTPHSHKCLYIGVCGFLFFTEIAVVHCLSIIFEHAMYLPEIFGFGDCFFKPFFHHFYLCLYGNPALRIQRYSPLPVPIETCDCRCLRLCLYEHDLMHLIPQPHLFLR